MEKFIIVGAFILFDIITGITKAIYKEGVNSTALRQGLFHKLSEVLAIVGSTGIEYGLKYFDIPDVFPLANIVIVYICLMECISIIENICIMNPQLYRFFSPYLEKLKANKEQLEKKDDIE